MHQEGLFVHVPHVPVLFRRVLAWYFMIPKLFSHAAQKEHRWPLCIHVLVLQHLDDGCYLWGERTYRSSLLNYISFQIFPHSCYILPRRVSAALLVQIQKLVGSFLCGNTALFVQDDQQHLATLVQAGARQHYHVAHSHVLPTTQLVTIQACTEALLQQFDMSHGSCPPTLVFLFADTVLIFPLHPMSD